MLVTVCIALLAGGSVIADSGIDSKGLTIPNDTLTTRYAAKTAPIHRHLDSGLNQVLGGENPFTTAGQLGFVIRDNSIQIIAVALDGFESQVEAWLIDNHATGVSSAGNLVQAFVPIDLLPELNANPFITFVRRPEYLKSGPNDENSIHTKVGNFTSEGVQAMNATEWHNSGLLGQGMRVAIIDEGFEGGGALLGTDLPEASRVYSHVFGAGDINSTNHGTACAEIIFDLAPQLSEMRLYAVKSEVDVANAIDRALSFGVHVISISLGTARWGPGDGTGVIADAINRYTDAGGIFVSSAGNQRLAHWQGSWNDSNGDGYYDFAHGSNVNYLATADGSALHQFPLLSEINVEMVWNQWNSPSTDLNIHLVRWDGVNDPEIVLSSEFYQTGQPGQLPVEGLSYFSVFGGYFGVAISYLGGPQPVDIEVMARHSFNTFQDSVQKGSILCPGDTANAITVGALDAGGTYPLEPYSSRGPTNGPGGSLLGGTKKPDIAGYANVSTASSGPRSGGGSFNGTSAACPHVAGAAALIWAANPSWTNSQVRSFLESNAIDKGLAGMDNDYGFGRLYLGSPPSSCSYSLSPSSQTFDSDGGSGSFSVSASSGCNWDATTSQGWIHITSGSSGSGNGTVSFTVDTRSNPSDRSGTIKVAGKTFTITQSGPTSCSYSISPTSRTHDSNGGTGTVSVSTTTGCSWEATSNKSWISITGGSSGDGNGTVSYSVGTNSGSSSRSGTLTIAGKTFTVTQSGNSTPPPAGDFTHYAVIAHTTGANNSVWQSSMSITNVSASQANTTLTYQYKSDKSVVRNVTVPPFGLVEWADATADLFNLGGKSSGVVTIEVDTNVLVAVRTFNSSADGTFGQSLPGATSSQSLAYGQFGNIGPVRRTPNFRTNIGVINTGSIDCSAIVYFVDGDGYYLGNVLSFNLAPGGWKQTNGALKAAGIDEAEGVYAVVEVQTEGAEVWSYGTVIDNSSGDPTALQMAIESPSGDPVHYAVIAHTTGANNSVWQSSMSICNVSASQANATLTYRYKSDRSVVRNVAVPAFGLVEWADTAVDLFGLSAKTSGVVTIEVDQSVMVAVRTFNSSANGTFGQSLPGASSSKSMSLGQFGLISPVRRSPDFRTNIGVINTGSIDCSVILYFIDGDGYYLGDVLGLNLAPGEWKQINAALKAAGINEAEGVYAVTEVQTEGAEAWAYGTVIDNSSGDPTALRMVIVE